MGMKVENYSIAYETDGKRVTGRFFISKGISIIRFTRNFVFFSFFFVCVLLLLM